MDKLLFACVRVMANKQAVEIRIKWGISIDKGCTKGKDREFEKPKFNRYSDEYFYG